MMFLRTDIYEQDDQLIIAIEVPGIDESMFEVSIDQHVLTIAGRRGNALAAPGRAYHRRERSSGTFRRDISLPLCIGEHLIRFVDAKLRDGVYVVRIPMFEKLPQTH
jgi:HSP20 family protein